MHLYVPICEPLYYVEYSLLKTWGGIEISSGMYLSRLNTPRCGLLSYLHLSCDNVELTSGVFLVSAGKDKLVLETC